MLQRCHLAAQHLELREGLRGVGTACLGEHAALEGVVLRGRGELQQLLREPRRAVARARPVTHTHNHRSQPSAASSGARAHPMRPRSDRGRPRSGGRRAGQGVAVPRPPA